MTNGLSTQEVVRLLELTPHPEGGFYRQTFRDSLPVGSPRAASTAIYYLLPGGGISHWHRVDAAEVWHFYAGAALELKIAAQGAPTEVLRLGAELAAGERPQAVVPQACGSRRKASAGGRANGPSSAARSRRL